MSTEVNYNPLKCFSVAVDNGVANVLINHPPINLMDVPLILELDQLADFLSADERVKVIVFRSADPDFFIAHADLNLLLAAQANPPGPDELSIVSVPLEKFRTMPKVSIAQIEGQAYGGGSEMALALDMRFAAIGRARLGQPETALGIIAAGGGCARLPGLVGRGRALEILLGCESFSAEEAERYGYVNRALPAEEIDAFVDALANRIASFPASAIAAVKEAVNVEPGLTVEQTLLREQRIAGKTLVDPESSRRINKALSLGLQQREVELEQFDEILSQLGEP